ncbi:hypothetical protein [Halorhodospira sp. 9622]|uniref:hypothetical protein n=1 Tax=Halorhodospira sp. 9622 TaxID=2899136 RepID=UPI001EE97810|nr:hypothetical protein [Halorhodospira sp. 9622]MCG5538942.1 hypothetical protein [Halorhodospira sp. 9622]
MRVVLPARIGPEELIESNIPLDDDGHQEWDPDKEYDQGERVVLTEEHDGRQPTQRIYRALTSNQGAFPAEHTIDEVGADEAKWQDLGGINRFRAFDEVVGSKSVSDASYDPELYNPEGQEALDQGVAFRFKPGVVTDSLTLLGLEASYLDVVVVNEDGVQYQKRHELQTTIPESDWHAYFFAEPERDQELVLTELPLVSEDMTIEDLPGTLEAEFRISAYNGGAPAKIGNILVGQSYRVGESGFGAEASIVDFSTKERDEFGHFRVRERAFANRAQVPVLIETARIQRVQRFLAQIRSRPAVYIASKELGPTVFGFYKRFRLLYQNAVLSECELTIEGLI